MSERVRQGRQAPLPGAAQPTQHCASDPRGWEVLDVACGNGNAALAAARSGTHATGIDYVPELLEGGAGH